MGEIFKFKGMVLEEIDPYQANSEHDVFKLVRWKSKERPYEWYFKMVKSVLPLKEKYKEFNDKR